MKRWAGAAFLVLAIVVAAAGESAACDLPSSPLDDPAVAAAVADVIAVVEVVGLGGGVASAKVLAAVKGDVKPGATLSIRGVHALDEPGARRGCGVATAEVGRRYLVGLWSPGAAGAAYDVAHPAAGLVPHDAAAQKSVEAALAKGHPSSAWTRSVAGPAVQTKLALDSRRGDAGAGEQIDLFVVVRNVGATAIGFHRRSWPEAQQTFCDLRIVGPDGQAVAARDVPIARTAIAEYFSKHGIDYESKLEPGAAAIILLQRVTTAESGWGYKEDLGFRYYPIARHGAHTVAAECHRFLDAASLLKTAAVELRL